MTTEDQCIAIAEICGYTAIMKARGFAEPRKFPRGTPPGKDAKTHGSEELPNYPGDLNAIHAAIKAQPENVQWLTFAMLADIVDAKIPAYLGTAAQWTEAFLKALGKWKS